VIIGCLTSNSGIAVMTSGLSCLDGYSPIYGMHTST
jgi:hypothetical protein